MSINRIQDEIDYRLKNGWVRCTIYTLQKEYEKLGYTFDRSCDCRSNAQYVTGERIGATYPVLTLYPIEMDTRLSAFHVDARRDKNFNLMQQLRNTHYAVAPGRIVEV